MQCLFTRFWLTHSGLRPEKPWRSRRVLARHRSLAPVFFSALLLSSLLVLPAFSQDARTETQAFGRGATITVVVHDPSGEILSSAAIVKLFRGTIPESAASDICNASSLRDFLRDHPDRREAATARRWLDGLSSSGKLGSK